MRLLADGWSVAFTYSESRDAALAFQDEARATLSSDKPQIEAFHADVRNDANNQALVEIVLARFGSIDALVNNAGVRRDALLYHMTHEQWDDVLQTTLNGTFSMTKAVLPAMVKQHRGAIVNVASLSGLHGVVGQTNYSAAKGGLIAFTRSLAREVARNGIRVNCVAPGLVETDMTADLDDEVRRAMIREIPMRRAVHADEVAAGIAFLLSDDAAAITGQTLCIDGGLSA